MGFKTPAIVNPADSPDNPIARATPAGPDIVNAATVADKAAISPKIAAAVPFVIPAPSDISCDAFVRFIKRLETLRRFPITGTDRPTPSINASDAFAALIPAATASAADDAFFTPTDAATTSTGAMCKLASACTAASAFLA
ncbi:hypothetical protein [Acidovorax anthurii]|uniref:hypothetical protein n=1 Tax=Paracidovorax anthurii TaxID=78229 RepID=UPI0011BEE893